MFDELASISDILSVRTVALTVASCLIGILGGFVGLALGTMRLPILIFTGVPISASIGTNIFVSSLSALTGAIRHWREGRVSLRVFLIVGLPAVSGAFLGGFSAHILPTQTIVFAVGLLVILQGIELIRRSSHHVSSERPEDLSPATDIQSRSRIFLGASGGLAVGILGGGVGLILGSIRLPLLLRILKVNPRTAAGTNMFTGFFMGSAGWLGHIFQGEVDYQLLAFMGPAAMVGSYYGAKLTGRVRPESLINVMGCVLIVVGAMMALQMIT